MLSIIHTPIFFFLPFCLFQDCLVANLSSQWAGGGLDLEIIISLLQWCAYTKWYLDQSGTIVSLKSKKKTCQIDFFLKSLLWICWLRSTTKKSIYQEVVCNMKNLPAKQTKDKKKNTTATYKWSSKTGSRVFCPHSLNWSRFWLSSSPHWCIITEEECEQISAFSRSAVFPFWVPNLFLHAILTSTEQAETLGKRSFTLRHALSVYDSCN